MRSAVSTILCITCALAVVNAAYFENECERGVQASTVHYGVVSTTMAPNFIYDDVVYAVRFQGGVGGGSWWLRCYSASGSTWTLLDERSMQGTIVDSRIALLPTPMQCTGHLAIAAGSFQPTFTSPPVVGTLVGGPCDCGGPGSVDIGFALREDFSDCAWTYINCPDVDDCASNPCGAGYTCIDKAYSYSCFPITCPVDDAAPANGGPGDCDDCNHYHCSYSGSSWNWVYCPAFGWADECTTECDEGYYLSAGDHTRVCADDGQLSDVTAVCSRVTCAASSAGPANGNAGSCDDAAVDYQATCETGCNAGYSLSEGSHTRTCLADGDLSDIDAVCTDTDGCASDLCNAFGDEGAECIDTAAPGTGYTCDCTFNFRMSTSYGGCRCNWIWPLSALLC